MLVLDLAANCSACATPALHIPITAVKASAMMFRVIRPPAS
jgi:hypothetical protein